MTKKITVRGVNYGFRWMPRRFWREIWLPTYHEGRGRYLSIGLWMIALFRGY